YCARGDGYYLAWFAY
nr:immunoglobulin heavy chain junction region [Mus musculus]